MGVIYLRTNLANGMQYVGQTKDIKNREHHWKLLKWRYANQLLTEDRNKYGLENFSLEILEECDDNRLDELERYYIEKYDTIFPKGYNTTKGGTISFHHSDETRKKMSEIAQGKKHIFKKGLTPWNKGKKNVYSDETIQRMSESHKKLLANQENHPMKGKHHSEEAKKKMSEIKKGKSNESRAKTVYKYKLDGELIAIYPTTIEAAKENGVSQSCISLRCSNNKEVKGYKWSYSPLLKNCINVPPIYI